jgi:hypothetical protein
MPEFGRREVVQGGEHADQRDYAENGGEDDAKLASLALL